MPRIEQVESLFHEAMSLPEGASLREWLEQHCDGDRELFEQVHSLVR